MTPANPKAKKTTYSAETKAAALAALLQGQGIQQVAEQYNLPPNTVKAWRARMRTGGSPVKDASVAPETRQVIGELLAKYLELNLHALAKQTKVFAEPVWIRDQSAEAMAVLHGVLTDKAVRLLEAMGGVHESAAS